ncbi:asparagine synthase-related protein [Priestia flexa]|uniref:asparagine synthase-related protein n=1 Tax=Priestia flexa TaxID=86664 RepID=UPI0009574D44|nr:asparagine synthase-related protein [Priestia flexa]MBY6088347.1 asparagine synthetase B [Priestia flexa]SIR46385.1 asparagine synthase (glutamine-hydrolysing) [Priestia flexa]
MSAIAGIYHRNNDLISQESVMSLLECLSPYQADDTRSWKKDNVALISHTQWITPESVGEQLPYYDYEKQLAITADAIIDNREELFRKLHIHDTESMITDSELILLAYEKWEEEAPKFLVGDFAFVIWDERKQQLFAARDFSGNRTLYFYKDDRKFSFCTAINPLFSLPYVKKEINEEWLAEFLAIPITFESTDASSTVYKAIQQVPPSHSITVGDNTFQLKRYCTLNRQETLRLKSNEEYEEAFYEVFQQAVNSKLRTRKKVGAHLSGGLDSGSVASFASRTLSKENKKLHTFSYVPIDGFQGWSPKSRVANEKPLIQSTVQYVGNIEDNYFNFEEKSPFSEIDEWLDIVETPYKFYENSFWLKGLYEQAAKQGMGVLLNGQRGNWTVSWGPALDYQAKLLKRANLGSLLREVHLYSRQLGVNKSRVFPVVAKKAFPKVHSLLSKKSPPPFTPFINPDFAQKFRVYDKLKQHGVNTNGLLDKSAYEIKRIQFAEPYYWSINGTYTTKLSLHHSLWDRDPTNDLRVVRFCLSIPENQFVQNGQDRSLIRRTTKGFLPDDIRLNQRVRGVQGADGIQRMTSDWSFFMNEMESVTKADFMSGYVDMAVVKSAMENLRNNPRPEYVFHHDFRVLMRSLILYRFMKRLI